MKGIFSLILAVLMTVSLAACSSPEEKKGNSISGAGKGSDTGENSEIQTAVY